MGGALKMARVFQDTQQKRVLGDKAPWYVEWRENGKRHAVKVGSKKRATDYAKRKDVELSDTNLGLTIKKKWDEFREEYARTIVAHMPSARSQYEVKNILKRFGEIAKPKLVSKINRKMLDEYVALRLKMRGKKEGDTLSEQTVRKELRTIRAALASAVDWRYLQAIPPMPRVKGLCHEKRFVTVEDFEKMLTALGAKNIERLLPAGSDDHKRNWWRALLVFAWATGMRIGAILELRWANVNLQSGKVFSRAKHNKSKKDKWVDIAAITQFLESLQTGSEDHLFDWPHDRTTLNKHFSKVQEIAGIKLDCHFEHVHTPSCHTYGFHDFRRSHATYNYGRVTDAALQQQMGHASFQTTQSYIKFAKKHQDATYNPYLPKCVARHASDSEIAEPA